MKFLQNTGLLMAPYFLELIGNARVSHWSLEPEGI